MSELTCVEYLYHYYEKSNGPFKNLSDLAIDEAQKVLNEIKLKNEVFASHRYEGYLERRKELEQTARNIFISKGGKPIRNVPHYMVIGECEWLQSWYKEGEYERIHISKFKLDTISFSYGDLFPTFSLHVTDNREYRKNVYTYEEIIVLIQKYGLPQYWNEDGRYGPERYIEVQVWSDEQLMKRGI